MGTDPMTLEDATPEDIESIAIQIAEDNGKEWDKLTNSEKTYYRIEATFSLSWFL